VIVDISKDLKAVVGKERRVQGSQMSNAVPPPTTEEVQVSVRNRMINKPETIMWIKKGIVNILV
jgi:hypothetical protein